LTLSFLRRICRLWQKRLHLQDWDVQIVFTRMFDMTEGKQGTISYNTEKKAAKIEILTPGDYPNSSTFRPQDIEQCVVHELLHLHCSGFDSDLTSLQQTSEEQMLNALAAAFVERKVA
jgi:hypothetical protein